MERDRFFLRTKRLKKFELNNKTIALNILFALYYTEKIRLAYKSKHNFKRENQVILLMITDGKKWHYLGVKSLPALLRGITSNHDGSFYCLNCSHSYSTEEKLKKHEKVCNDHDYCYVEMADEDNKILKYNHGETSMRVPFIIYAELECLLEKMHSCQNKLEKSYTQKKTPSGYSLFTNCSFGVAKNKVDCYRGKDCMEKFCKDFRELAMRVVKYEKKEMVPLTDEEIKSYEKQNVCYICKKRFSTDALDKKYYKVRDHCHCTGKFRGAAHGQLECLGGNTEKYITFPVPISKELDNRNKITYKLKFIDSSRFTSTSLSNLIDNLSGKKECKGCKERRKVKSAHNFIGPKNIKLNYKCKECKKRWLKPVNGLIKKFPNIR